MNHYTDFDPILIRERNQQIRDEVDSLRLEKRLRKDHAARRVAPVDWGGVHTQAMFAVMAVIALVLYDRLGLMILKRTWLNVDLMWAATLVAARPGADVAAELMLQAIAA